MVTSEKIKKQNREACKKWRLKNKDKVKELNLKHKDKYKEYRKEYRKIRSQNDPVFKLRHNVRCLIYFHLKNNNQSKSISTEKILGCTFDEFKQYIESQFESWMNWDNYGGRKVTTINTTWDIDHIIPASSAKTPEEILKLNHHTNLRPLCSYHNRFIKRDT